MNWLQTTMGEVCLPVSQRDPTRNGVGSFRYIDISGIDRETKAISRAESVPCAEAPSRARKLVQAGDVLVSTVRPNLNAIGIVPEELDGEIASTGFCVLRANRDLVIPRYLFFRAQHQEFVDFLVANATGASYPAVTEGVVRRAPLPLPPLPEQARISEFLDEADRLRRLRCEADARAARILPALFLKVFGDPATNPMGWPVRPLGQLGTLERGKSRHRPRNDPRLLGGPYPFIQTGDVANANGHITSYTSTYSEFGLAQSRLWPPGTLCITIAANIAATAILDFEACFPDSVVGFTPSVDTNVGYVRVLLSFLKPMLEACAPQAAQKNINLEILSALKVPVPSSPLQADFFRVHNAVSQLTDQHTRAGEKLDFLWGSLMARAFSGQLTAKWRAKHMKELLAEMQQQVRLLNLPLPKKMEAVR